ncbi:MAG: hypothetical protein VYC91_07180 [Acidobacteriota bacterium]|nr:hypothetical protein [Acidobacteriota bacterium]
MTLDNQESRQIQEGAETPTSKLVSTEPQPFSEDEVTLVDLWIILIKRKVRIGAVVAMTLLAGIVSFFFSGTKPQQQYQFSTTIELGQMPDQGWVFDSPSTALAKVVEAYIPLSRQELETEGWSVPAVQAKTQGELVVLKTVASSQKQAAHVELLESITQRLLTEHLRVIESYRTGVISELERARLRLERLSIPRILADGEKEPETQINDQDGATLEMLRLEWAKEQADQEHVVIAIEERLRGFRETRVVLPPMLSLVATTAPKRLGTTLSVAGFLGLLLGIFAAFGAEFLAYSRKEMSKRGLLQK